MIAQMDGSEVHARGYVYVLVNSSMPGLVKVGRTARLPRDRAAELSGSTGVPTPFVVAFEQFFSDSVVAEKQLHAELARRGFRLSNNREFFSAPAHDVIRIILSMEGHAEVDDDAVTDDSSWADEDSDATAEELTRLLPIAYAGEGPEAEQAQQRLEQLIGDSFYSRPGEDFVDIATALENGTDGYLVDPEEASETYRAAIEAGSLIAYTGLADVLLGQAHEAYMADSERLHDTLRRRALQVLKDGAKAGNYYCWLELGKLFLEDKQTQNAAISFRNFFDNRDAGIRLSVEPHPSVALASYISGCNGYLDACLRAQHPIEHIQHLKGVRTSLVQFGQDVMARVRALGLPSNLPEQHFASKMQWCKTYLFDQPWTAPVRTRGAPESTEHQEQAQKSWWTRTFGTWAAT